MDWDDLDRLHETDNPGLLNLYLSRPIRYGMEEIEKRGLESHSSADVLWVMGLSKRVADGITSGGIDQRLEAFDHFLTDCEPTANNKIAEDIFSSPLVAQYLEKSIDSIGENHKLANALAFVKYADLGEKTRVWLENRGLTVIDQPIQLHLRHKDDFGLVGQVPCHEVGWAIFGFQNAHKSLDEIKQEGIRAGYYTTHYPDEGSPQRCLALVQYQDRWYINIATKYVGSNHPQSRGIFAPYYPSGAIYMGTANSYTPDRVQNFYVRQTGINEIVSYGLEKIYDQLQVNKK